MEDKKVLKWEGEGGPRSGELASYQAVLSSVSPLGPIRAAEDPSWGPASILHQVCEWMWMLSGIFADVDFSSGQ